jgi:hypothetical protein
MRVIRRDYGEIKKTHAHAYTIPDRTNTVGELK